MIPFIVVNLDPRWQTYRSLARRHLLDLYREPRSQFWELRDPGVHQRGEYIWKDWPKAIGPGLSDVLSEVEEEIHYNSSDEQGSPIQRQLILFLIPDHQGFLGADSGLSPSRSELAQFFNDLAQLVQRKGWGRYIWVAALVLPGNGLATLNSWDGLACRHLIIPEEDDEAMIAGRVLDLRRIVAVRSAVDIFGNEDAWTRFQPAQLGLSASIRLRLRASNRPWNDELRHRVYRALNQHYLRVRAKISQEIEAAEQQPETGLGWKTEVFGLVDRIEKTADLYQTEGRGFDLAVQAPSSRLDGIADPRAVTDAASAYWDDLRAEISNEVSRSRRELSRQVQESQQIFRWVHQRVTSISVSKVGFGDNALNALDESIQAIDTRIAALQREIAALQPEALDPFADKLPFSSVSELDDKGLPDEIGIAYWRQFVAASDATRDAAASVPDGRAARRWLIGLLVVVALPVLAELFQPMLLGVLGGKSLIDALREQPAGVIGLVAWLLSPLVFYRLAVKGNRKRRRRYLQKLQMLDQAAERLRGYAVERLQRLLGYPSRVISCRSFAEIKRRLGLLRDEVTFVLEYRKLVGTHLDITESDSDSTTASDQILASLLDHVSNIDDWLDVCLRNIELDRPVEVAVRIDGGDVYKLSSQFFDEDSEFVISTEREAQ